MVVFKVFAFVIVVIYRQVWYRIRRKSLFFKEAGLTAPIGIVGQPNSITWDVGNLVLTKITRGSISKYTIKNKYQFSNSTDSKEIKVSFYGIDQIITKIFSPNLIQVIKEPIPEPSLTTKRLFNLKRNDIGIALLKPLASSNFFLRLSKCIIIHDEIILRDFKISIVPIDLSKLFEELTEHNDEVNFEALTKTIKNEKYLLPKSNPRPYNEIVMEGRWFR